MGWLAAPFKVLKAVLERIEILNQLSLVCVLCFFFFKQKTAYEISECDWSSDVCSSDLTPVTSRRRHTRILNVTGVRSEERRVGKECKISVDLGGRRMIKKKSKKHE